MDARRLSDLILLCKLTLPHRTVYALFRCRIRTVDSARRAALRKELLQQLLQHSSAESLDAKLSRVTVNGDDSARRRLPPPSTDQQAWWNTEQGSFAPPPLPPRPRNRAVTNPFEPDFYADRADAERRVHSAPRSPVSKRAVPAPPPKPLLAGEFAGAEATPVEPLVDISDETSTTSIHLPANNPAFQAVKRKQPPPAPPSRKGSSTAHGLAASAQSEKIDRHDTGESWQILP